MLKRVFYTLLIISACGCATAPETPEQRLNLKLENIKNHHKNGDLNLISQNINDAISQPEGANKLSQLLISNQKIYLDYNSYLQTAIPQSTTPAQIIRYANQIYTNSTISAFQAQHIEQLKNLIQKTAIEKNANNEIEFTLAHDFSLLPYLLRGQPAEIITDRTIKILQENKSGNRPLARLIALVESQGPNSAIGQKVSAKLPSLNIKRSELIFLQNSFPSFYAKRLSELSLKANLQFKGLDRLASDDLSAHIRSQYKSVDWTNSPENDALTILIERVRHDEKTIPETSMTITYAYHEVNILSAVLLMPKNASYLYDIVTSGNEIEYGYVVNANRAGRMTYEEVVRGKIGGPTTRCQNSRVQNVFGGVSPANFVANDDMSTRCAGRSTYNLEEARQEIIRKVGQAITNIAEVQRSIDNY